MENSELALALREHYLEKIAIYLSRCGLQSNLELLDRGYPDVGWDPVEGERYLDFLRFCVWVNGKYWKYFFFSYCRGGKLYWIKIPDINYVNFRCMLKRPSVLCVYHCTVYADDTAIMPM